MTTWTAKGFAGARRVLVVMCGVLMLAACSATFQNHGFTPSEDELSAILPGLDTRDTVADTIGQPSASGVLRDDAWYYISSRVRNFAYRAPETIEREIVAISFTQDGTVENIERFGLEDGRVVTLSRRITETSVQDFGLIQQLLRNLGQIDVGGALAGDG